MSPKLLNILLVLAPLVLYYGYLNPLYTGEEGFIWTPPQSIFALKARNDQYANAINQIDLIAEGANKLTKDYNAIDPEILAKTKILLPDSIDPIKLRNEVISIANKSGIAIRGLKLEPDSKTIDPSLGSYTIAFSINAHYEPLKQLLEAYERNLRLYSPEVFSIVQTINEKKDNNSAAVEDPENLTSLISYRVYYLLK